MGEEEDWLDCRQEDVRKKIPDSAVTSSYHEGPEKGQSKWKKMMVAFHPTVSREVHIRIMETRELPLMKAESLFT